MKKFAILALAAVGTVAIYEAMRRNGMLDQVCGKMKQTVGDLTDDEVLHTKGVLQSAKGEAKHFFAKSKDKLEDTVEKVKDFVHED